MRTGQSKQAKKISRCKKNLRIKSNLVIQNIQKEVEDKICQVYKGINNESSLQFEILQEEIEHLMSKQAEVAKQFQEGNEKYRMDNRLITCHANYSQPKFDGNLRKMHPKYLLK